LKEVFDTKETWRSRALSLLAQQATTLQQNSATTINPLGENFTEYRHSVKPIGVASKYNKR